MRRTDVMTQAVPMASCATPGTTACTTLSAAPRTALPVALRTALCALLASLVAVLALLVAPVPARASGLDLSATVSATIYLHDSDTPIKGSTFSLYKVAELDASGDLTLTSDFASAGVSLGSSSDYGDWRETAKALQGYVDARAAQGTPISAAKTATTNHSGYAWVQAEPGAYLVLGTPAEVRGARYTPQASLVVLPVPGADGSWNYEPVLEPKWVREDEPAPETTSVTGLKAWSDEGYASERPSTVTLVLLRKAADGSVEQWDSVEVRAAGGWQHRWDGLDGSYSWEVVESPVPEGYTVSTSVSGDVYRITNTRVPGEPEEPGTPKTSSGRAPQTGDVSGPELLVLAAAVAVLALGLALQRRS